MREARQRIDWNHTASVLAIIAEVNRDREKRSAPFEPREFNPFLRETYTRKPQKTAAELFAKLAGWGDGQQPQTVTEKTWKPKKRKPIQLELVQSPR